MLGSVPGPPLALRGRQRGGGPLNPRLETPDGFDGLHQPHRFIMKTLSLVCTVALLAALTAGCDASLSSDADSAIAPAAAAGAGGPAASGSGHLTVDDEYRTFSFHAREAANGTVAGSFNLQARQSGNHLKGNVTCVTALPNNRAIMAGLITEADDSGFREGGNFAFMVEDNGAGNASAPDRLTLVAQFGLSPGFPTEQSLVDFLCASNGSALPALTAIEGGNITVRP